MCLWGGRISGQTTTEKIHACTFFCLHVIPKLGYHILCSQCLSLTPAALIRYILTGSCLFLDSSRMHISAVGQRRPGFALSKVRGEEHCHHQALIATRSRCWLCWSSWALLIGSCRSPLTIWAQSMVALLQAWEKVVTAAQCMRRHGLPIPSLSWIVFSTADSHLSCWKQILFFEVIFLEQRDIGVSPPLSREIFMASLSSEAGNCCLPPVNWFRHQWKTDCQAQQFSMDQKRWQRK